jgi:type VI secretion system secreted protein Hcp
MVSDPAIVHRNVGWFLLSPTGDYPCGQQTMGRCIMAIDMAIDFNDGALKGEYNMSEGGYKNTTQVLSWSWSADFPISIEGGAPTTGKPDLSELSFTKYTDAISAELMKKLWQGLNGKISDVTLHVVVKGHGETLKIKLTDVWVSAVSLGGTPSDDRLTENVSLSFVKAEVWDLNQSTTGIMDLTSPGD